MKLLVSGCSITSGFAFDNERENPNLWCNQLAQYLNADLTNVATPGYDNQGIFLKAFDELTKHNYDLAIIQVSELTRVVLSPTIHGSRMITEENIFDETIPDSVYKKFYQTFLTLNNPIEHWNRFTKLVNISKSFKTKIMFVNGLMTWDQNFFNNNDSKFHRFIINDETLPDEQITVMLKHVNQTRQQIDLSSWLTINPIRDYEVDTANDNLHPGPLTHKLLFNQIKQKL